MTQMRYYDKNKRQLIYVEKTADANFWDGVWNNKPDEDIRKNLLSIKKSIVSTETKKYLKPSDGKILEGGCGNGQHVAALYKNGFHVIGVDFARETVFKLNKSVPEFEIEFGDVRSLPFPDENFSGYWSLGVIEHFFSGYESIMLEMKRVLIPGGYLFLTFPYMSVLRKVKAFLKSYPNFSGTDEPDEFYQYALDHRSVVQNFERNGFHLIRSKSMARIKGAKDELSFLRPHLQNLSNYNGNSIFVKIYGKTLDSIFSLLGGHSILLVFRKE